MVLLLLQCLKNHGTFQKNGTITECKYSNMVQVYPEVKGFGKRSHGSSTRKIPKDPNKKPCTSIPSPPKLKRKYYTEKPHMQNLKPKPQTIAYMASHSLGKVRRFDKGPILRSEGGLGFRV